jgi:hypothetical protein
LYEQARALYSQVGRVRELLDCDHVLSVLPRFDGVYNEETEQRLLATLVNGWKARNWSLVSRCGGDLARTILCRCLDHLAPREAVADALQVLQMVDLAETQMWSAARDTEHSVGVRIELANNQFHNLETKLLAHYHVGDLRAAGVSCAATKQRIHRDSLLKRTLVNLANRPDPSRDEALLQALLLQQMDALAREDGKRIAFIEHFALSDDQLFIWIYVSGGTGDPTITTVLSDWPTKIESSNTFGARGRNQAVAARGVRDELQKEFERFSGRAAMLYGEEANPESAERAAIQEMTDSTREHIQSLGVWTFPPDVIEFLNNENVEHLVLSPDPRFFSLPWAALGINAEVALVDQIWTFALVPSQMVLFDIQRRRRDPCGDRLVIVTPDREVNESLGGQREREEIQSRFDHAESLDLAAATVDNVRARARSAKWIHVRSHGVLSDGRFVPRLFDTPWPIPLRASDTHPFLVATCCRTGEAGAVAQDVQGLLEVCEADDFSGLVAPVVSVEGFSAREFSTHLYEELSRGLFVGEALRVAARAVRERLIHPATWGVYLCVGDARISPQVPAQRASQFSTTSVVELTASEFNRFGPVRGPAVGLQWTEVAWFAGPDRKLIGVVILDHDDEDYAFITMRHDGNKFRADRIRPSFPSKDAAIAALLEALAGDT